MGGGCTAWAQPKAMWGNKKQGVSDGCGLLIGTVTKQKRYVLTKYRLVTKDQQ